MGMWKGTPFNPKPITEHYSVRDMTEKEFSTQLTWLMRDIIEPYIKERVENEVNRQIKELTAVLVSGLVRK